MEYSKNNIDIKYKKNTHLIYDMVKTKIDDNMPIDQASFRFLTHKKNKMALSMRDTFGREDIMVINPKAILH